jgi:hypothetical protein
MPCYLQDEDVKKRHRDHATIYKKDLEYKFKEMQVQFEYKIVPNVKWDFPVLHGPEDGASLPELELPLSLYAACFWIYMLTI